jgi:hypothetical protein
MLKKRINNHGIVPHQLNDNYFPTQEDLKNILKGGYNNE